jgi:hypothetical protein
MNLTHWAIRNGVSVQALQELREMFGLEVSPVVPSRPVTTEAGVQSLIRLEGAKNGLLWRNNVGVLQNPETGQPIRYGLANDSKQLNEKLKSGDLIGWQKILITPEHVGTVIARFTSRECKHPGWKYTGSARELAQLRWAQVVMRDGGDACFASSEGTL